MSNFKHKLVLGMWFYAVSVLLPHHSSTILTLLFVFGSLLCPPVVIRASKALCLWGERGGRMNQDEMAELPMSQGTFDEIWASNFVNNLDKT